MKMIMLYPIQPDANGASYGIIAGAVLLNVTEKCGNYYLHALVDVDEEEHEMRSIAAYSDHQEMPNETGLYIGSTSISYRYSHVSGLALAYHFFDRTGIAS